MLRRPSALLPTVLLLLIASTRGYAQSVTLFDIDTTAFPTIRARFYTLDSAGNAVKGISAGSITLTEDGRTRKVLRVDCPPPVPPSTISSVLTIDVSGSMSIGKVRNIDLAKAAARAWVDGLPDAESECALSSFDDRAYLHRDFTVNREALRAMLDQLAPNGGTNYDKGLMDEYSGAIPIAAHGKHKRIVVFLTDGLGEGSVERITEMALKERVTIFVVTLGMPVPDVLKQICERTGGLWMGNVTTVDQAVTAYRRALAFARGTSPCTIEWSSDPSCEAERTVVCAVGGSTTSVTYRTPRSGWNGVDIRFAGGTLYSGTPLAVTSWNAESNVYYSWGQAPGTSNWRDIIVRSHGRPVNISGISTSLPGIIYADPAQFPMSLGAGEERTVRIWFKPKDSCYSFARLELKTDACENVPILARGGIKDKGACGQTLRIVTPNGGERFASGSIAPVKFEGISPDDEVRIDISTNKGTSWLTVAPSVKGLEQLVRMPNVQSDQCLARVTQLASSETGNAVGSTSISSMDLHIASPSGIQVDSTGTWMIVSGLATGTSQAITKVYNMSSGKSTEFRSGYYAVILPDNQRVFSNSGGFVYMNDLTTGKQLWKTNLPDVALTKKIETTSDGKILLVEAADGPILLISPSNGQVLVRLPRTTRIMYDATITPDGNRIALCENDSCIHLFDGKTGKQIARMTLPDKPNFYSLKFSRNGSLLVSTASNEDADVWDARTGNHLYRLTTNSTWRSFILAKSPADFSPDAQRVVAVSDSGDAGVYDAAMGQELFRLRPPKPANGKYRVLHMATYSPDGSMIVLEAQTEFLLFDAYSGAYRTSVDKGKGNISFSGDGGAFAYLGKNNAPTLSTIGMQRSLQSDVSDNVWSLVAGSLGSIPSIVFAPQQIGTSKDSTISAVITNTGTTPVTVTGTTIPTRTNDFRIVSSTIPRTLAPGEQYRVEISFQPRSASMRKGELRVETSLGTVSVELQGSGILLPISLATKDFDLGTVPSGSEKSTTLNDILINSGREPAAIADVRIEGPDSTQFNPVLPSEGFSLRAGEAKSIPIVFNAMRNGRAMTRIAFVMKNGTVLRSTIHAQVTGEDVPAESYTDPTTFRTIAVPNAIIPKRGSVVFGCYDLVGLMGGYSLTDNIMLLAGGSMPLPDDWGGLHGTMFGSYSIGVKFGTSLSERFNGAVGYQYGHSLYRLDQTVRVFNSDIDAHTLYTALSYGTDDSRVSMDLGYILKYHVTSDQTGFNSAAYLVSLGGDYRIGERWKIAAEVFTIRTLGYVPVIATVRYFGHTWAIDAGIGYLGITTDGTEQPSIPIAPVVSAVWRW